MTLLKVTDKAQVVDAVQDGHIRNGYSQQPGIVHQSPGIGTVSVSVISSRPNDIAAAHQSPAYE